MYWLKMSNLALLLGATAWLSKAPDWEPLLACIGFLTTFLVQDFRERKKTTSNQKTLEKDKDNFEEYSDLLSETELLYVLNNDVFNLRTDMGFVKKLGKFIRRSEQVEGEFHNEKLQKKFSEMVVRLRELKNFLATHFFVPNQGVTTNSDGEFLLLLYPELKYSGKAEEREIYQDRQRELQELIDAVVNSHDAYRRLVKKQLHL